jgi:hypothetical protein
MEADRQKLIEQALLKLDTNNDDHWTAEGLPRLDAVASGIRRAEVTAVAPHFTRQHPTLELPEAIRKRRKAEAELAEVERQKAELAAREKAAKKEHDEVIAATDKPRTEAELMRDIQNFHRQMLEVEMFQAQKLEEARLAMNKIGIVPPSPLDTAIAKKTEEHYRKQALLEHQRRSA